MYTVIIISKIQFNSSIVGLSYRLLDSNTILEVSKRDFKAFFSGYNVLNAKLTSDLKVLCTNKSYPISVVTRKVTNSRKVSIPSTKENRGTINSSFPDYDLITLPDNGDVVLYHGSQQIIKSPIYGKGRRDNDYGLGFYCTQSIELAKEWGSRLGVGGFVNKYSINLNDLKILRLDTDTDIDLLRWVCILSENRDIANLSEIQASKLRELQSYFRLPKYNSYDIITGHRADDSYFSSVRDFLTGAISLEMLGEAFKTGNLGNQVVIKSKKAFNRLRYLGSQKITSPVYQMNFMARDTFARNYYRTHKCKSSKRTTIDDILRFMRRKSRNNK